MCSWKSDRWLFFEGVLWAENQENPFQSFHDNRDEPCNVVLPSVHANFHDDDDADHNDEDNGDDDADDTDDHNDNDDDDDDF